MYRSFAGDRLLFMAKKKPPRTKKSSNKNTKRSALKIKPASRKVAASKRTAARPKRAKPGQTRTSRERSSSSTLTAFADPVAARTGRGLGADSAGQSGDIQGLSRREVVDSESVTELAEEGQDYEAGIVSGVENAPDADQGEVRTREVPEDDVPEEYQEEQ